MEMANTLAYWEKDDWFSPNNTLNQFLTKGNYWEGRVHLGKSGPSGSHNSSEMRKKKRSSTQKDFGKSSRYVKWNFSSGLNWSNQAWWTNMENLVKSYKIWWIRTCGSHKVVRKYVVRIPHLLSLHWVATS